MQIAGFVLPGLMIVAFGLLVGLLARTTLAAAGAALLIVSGFARIAAGLFPLDACCAAHAPSFSERMHNTAGATYVATAVAAALVWCGVSERTFRTDPANVGLFQRASFGVLNLWVLVFAVVVWSRVANDSM